MQPTWTRIGDPSGGVLLTCGVTGANHSDKGLPCQDASLAGIHYYKGHAYTLLAVADGHGSERYSRSQLGAHFAVQAAAEAAARWMLFAVECYEQSPGDWFTNARNDFGARFARMLRQAWERNVTEHLAAYPLTEAEQQQASGQNAYGTTIALALVFRDQVFVGAIGDSTVLVVCDSGGGETAADLLAGDGSQALGLTTHSLASADAACRWQIRVLPLEKVHLLCAVTDGFTDSLTDALRTLVGVYRDTRVKGFDWLRDKWPEFLARLTEQGVGDDIATVLYFPPEPTARRGFQPPTIADVEAEPSPAEETVPDPGTGQVEASTLEGTVPNFTIDAADETDGPSAAG